MVHGRRRWRVALGAVALVSLVLALALRTERAGAWVCAELRARLPEALDAEVELGRCLIDPLGGSVEVRGLSVRPRGEGSVRVEAERAAVSLRGLFLGGVALHAVEVVRPQVFVRLPAADAPGAGPGCPLELVKRVRVGQLRLTEGRVAVEVGPGRLLQLEGISVDAELGRRVATLEAHSRTGAVTWAGRTYTLGTLAVEAELEVEEAQVSLHRAQGNVEGVVVSLGGVVSALCDPAPQLALTAQLYVPLEAAPRLGLSLPAPSGQVVSKLWVSGRADAPSARAEVQASGVALGPFTPGDFTARLAWAGARVTLEELVTRAGDGEVRVTGELSLGPGYPVTVKVETHEASFARILERAGVPGSWVEFPATVKSTLTGSLAPAFALGGDVELRTGRFQLAARAWNAPASTGLDILGFSQAQGRFRVGLTAQAATFEDVALRVGSQEATRVRGAVTLHYDLARGLDVEVVADQVDLADFGAIAELPWAGQGQVRATVRGPYERVVVDAQATLRDFKLWGYSLGVVQAPIHYEGDTLSFPSIAAQKGQTQYSGDVALQFRDSGLHTRATLQLPDGRVEDVVDLLADLSPAMQNLQAGVLTGRVTALMAIDSPASAFAGVIVARVRDTAWYERRLGAANVIARFVDGEALVLEPTVFEGPLGRTAAEGRWSFAGPLDYRLAIEGGSLAELVDPAGARGLPVDGTLMARATVGGDTDTMRLTGWLASPEVRWKGHPLGPMHLDARLVGRDLETEGTLFPGVQGQLALTMRNEWPFRSTLQVQLDDLAAFLPESAASLAVQLKGTVQASGPLMEVDQWRARARLDALQATRGEVSATNVEPVVLAWNAGGLAVESLLLRGPSTELAASGTWGPATVDLKTRGSLDLRLLSSLWGQVERTQGRLDFTAAFSGPARDPALAGRAEVSDVRLSVKDQDLAVRALSGRAEFSESRILVQDVQGFLNDGRVRVRGDLRHEGLAFKTVELQVDLDDVTTQVLPEVPVTVTGSLLLASRDAKRFQLSGGLDVVKFRYTRPLALESLLATAREKAVPSEDKPDEWLRFDVDLATAGDVRIDNNLARARLGGRVKVTGTNVKPVLVGAVEVGEGAQAFFRGNTFSVGRGLLQFNGLWPTFDLSAQSQVREYLITVKAFGRLEDPKLSFSSEPALADTDILSLLTLGVTSRERLTERSGAGLAAEALLSASGLDQQVQRFLSHSVGLKDQQVRLTTSFNEVSGTAEPAVTWESKVLSDNLKVGVTQPVTGRGTRAQAEYRINQRVSARAQWDNQNQNTTVGNPGVDLRFRFEWE